MATAADVGSRSEIEAFLFHEAWLLDHGRLAEWLGLFTDDATYWIPLEAGQTDPVTSVSIVYDDRALLEVRVRQFLHPRAHARIPAPRTVHQVGNVQVVEAGDRAREISVQAKQMRENAQKMRRQRQKA